MTEIAAGMLLQGRRPCGDGKPTDTTGIADGPPGNRLMTLEETAHLGRAHLPTSWWGRTQNTAASAVERFGPQDRKI